MTPETAPEMVEDGDSLRQRLIGLGERSIKKSYYPELQRRGRELERFRSLLDQAGDAIFLVEAGWRVVDCNEAAHRLLGRKREAILNRDLRELLGVDELPADLDPATPLGGLPDAVPVRNMVRGGVRSGARRLELVLPGRDEPRFLELSLSTHEHDGSRYAVVMGRDVTRRRETEDALRLARDKAEEASRAKSEFLANVSHELRTPLSGVLGMLQLLKQDPDDPDRAEYLDVALRSTRGLMTVLGDILDLSTIERGVFAVRTTAFEPREVAREVLGGFEPLAQAKGLEMETRLDPGMPEELLGDAGRLRQILFNLVGNAVKFTAQGRVRLEMSLPDGPAGAPRRLLCSVVDTGIGIPDDKIEAVLEPFTQADGSLSRHFGGVGLGLSIVRRLVHLLGGNLQIASRPGQGTEVLFTMPVSLLDDAVALAPAAAVRPGPEPDGPDERRRILAVEDDPGLQLLLRRMLERHDLRVDTASDGAEALDRLAHGRFDLVLMDVQMPSMDGCEAVRAIRSGARPGVDPAVPVVAISAHALPEDRARAMEAGMDDYLTKPFTAGDLLGIIKRWAPRRPSGKS